MTDSRTLFRLWSDVDREAHDLLSPITSEAQHGQALATIDELMQEVGDDQAHPLLSLLDLLADRVEAFESVAYPVPPAPPHRVLAFLMEQHSLTQKDLGAATGIDQSNLSKLLRGDRAFTAGQITVLSGHFRINPGVFLRTDTA
jgi:HTH-type transcriptional regulator / antitoxin HigA